MASLFERGFTEGAGFVGEGERLVVRMEEAVVPVTVSERGQARISFYPRRSSAGSDEAMVDARAIAFSKDTGPSGGFWRRYRPSLATFRNFTGAWNIGKNIEIGK